MQVQISVALVHWMLGRTLLSDDVIVDYVVVWLLQNLPGLGNGLHQAPLRNPK